MRQDAALSLHERKEVVGKHAIPERGKGSAVVDFPAPASPTNTVAPEPIITALACKGTIPRSLITAKHRSHQVDSSIRIGQRLFPANRNDCCIRVDDELSPVAIQEPMCAA